MDSPSENSPSWLARGVLSSRSVAVVLLVVHSILLLASIRRTYITVDEAMNVTAGVSYWRTGRFFIYRVNPPLTKMLAVLPVLALQPRADFPNLSDVPLGRAEFEAGLLFTNQNSQRIFDLVCLARLAGVVWSVLGGWLIFCWARELFGGTSACLALSLWCFDPYILGHAALVTADVPAAVAGLAASYAFWHYLREPSWKRAIISGLLLGVASLTKLTLLVFYGLWPILWAVDRWGLRRRAGDPPRSTAWGQMFLIFFVSLDLINFGYACQGTGIPLGDYPFISRFFTGRPDHAVGNRFHDTALGAIPVPLPQDYLRGIDVQRVDFEETRQSYLAGVWRRSGWWYYYLYALAVKEPLGTLALILWGLIQAFKQLRSSPDQRLNVLMLIAPGLMILGFVSSQAGFTQHSRYIIPALPYLMINAGRLIPARSHSQWAAKRWLVWGLLVTAAGSSLLIYPHSLSYFNEAAGGPLAGHKHLVESNIDWGQDLLSLKEWLAKHPEAQAQPLGLAYCNFHIDPRLAGLTYKLPPSGLETVSKRDGSSDPMALGPQPGYYAVSVNFLRGIEFPIADGQGGFRQTRPHEFAYFLAFRPIARAGYSIYIYRITTEEANAVRRQMGLPSLRASARPLPSAIGKTN